MRICKETIQIKRSRLFALLVIAISTLIALTFYMSNGALMDFDYAILNEFHKVQSTALSDFFSGITWLGSLLVLFPLYIIALLLLPLYFKKLFTIGFIGTILTTHAIKYVVERPRPSFFPTTIDMPIDFSFPSAHTSQIVVFALLLWIVFYRSASLGSILFGCILVICALGVAVSRMYLQVHFTTDILAGCMVAIAWYCIALLSLKSGESK